MRDDHSGGLVLCEHREGSLVRFLLPGVLPGVECLRRDLRKQVSASGAEVVMGIFSRELTEERQGQEWWHCHGRHWQELQASPVLTQTLRAPGPGERSNYYSWLSWALPTPGEDVDKNMDVDDAENKDVGMGKHKKTEHRQDVAGCGLGEMSTTGKDVAHGKDVDQRKNKDQTIRGTVYLWI